MQENIYVEIFHLKDIKLLKMDENVNDVAMYKYNDMVQNERITTNSKFELVSSKHIVVNHGKCTWLNDF